jgi:hypothetical protein
MTFEIKFESLEAYKQFMAEPTPNGVTLTIGNVCNNVDIPSFFIVTLEFIKTQAWELDRDLFVAWLLTQTVKPKNNSIRHREKNIPAKEDVIRRLIQEEFDLTDNDKHHNNRNA